MSNNKNTEISPAGSFRHGKSLRNFPVLSDTKKIALTGLLCALGAVIMLLGGVIPMATFACPMLAGLVLIPVFVECGQKLAYGAYIAVAVLGLILCPDKEAALLFAFIGHYPVLRWRLDQVKSGLLRIIAKLGVFNACILVMYALILWVFRMDQIIAEYREMGRILTLATLLLGNICLILYDKMIAVFTGIYVYKFRDKLIK